MTLFQLLTEGIRSLEQAGAPDAKQDARQLLLAAFGMDMVHFLLNRMQPMEENDFYRQATEHYRQMIVRRRRRNPIQQILGTQEFMGMTFFVNPHVLIPRQDTETLVELVLKEQKGKDKELLDLCTGSGCIAISLSCKGGYGQVVATDISSEALKVAASNSRKLFGAPIYESADDGLHQFQRNSWDDMPTANLWLLQGDLFEALEREGVNECSRSYPRKFDIITANPPYIPTAVIAALEPEVRDHEPMLALDGTADGLHYYRRIALEAKKYLNENGTLYLEIGHDQGEAVRCLFEEQGYHQVRVYKDLPGHDRVVCVNL